MNVRIVTEDDYILGQCEVDPDRVCLDLMLYISQQMDGRILSRRLLTKPPPPDPRQRFLAGAALSLGLVALFTLAVRVIDTVSWSDEAMMLLPIPVYMVTRSYGRIAGTVSALVAFSGVHVVVHPTSVLWWFPLVCLLAVSVSFPLIHRGVKVLRAYSA